MSRSNSEAEAPHPSGPLPLSVAPASRAYVEALYEQHLADPGSLPAPWGAFFQGFELAMCPRSCVAAERARKQGAVARLTDAYRDLGHRLATTDPLAEGAPASADLDLARFGLGAEDLDTVFDAGGVGGRRRATLASIVHMLQETYCDNVGVEYRHIQDPRMRAWLERRVELARNRPHLGRDAKLDILTQLLDADVFETFLHTRYPGQKRFSLEGAETLIPALHAIVELAPELGVEELVLGMAHRGRLNVLANILDKPYSAIFSEFEGTFPPGSVAGDGDVKYHKGFRSDHVNRSGRTVQLSLTANPSHLEAVDPVVLGRTRAKQRQRGDSEARVRVVPLLVHGDAAFSGQGMVAETLNLSRLPGYCTGGTLHLIVNNRIGFTASPGESRSTTYVTDVAKMIEAPVFHVNGDDPEAVVYVVELALRFRQAFGRDVVIDLVCYRRWGHNEGDEPAFTQPLLYQRIRSRRPVRELYTRTLVQAGVLTEAQDADQQARFRARLQLAYEDAQQAAPLSELSQAFVGRWAPYGQPWSWAPAPTAVDSALLLQAAEGLCRVPEGFHLNPKVARQLPERLAAVREGGTLDWGFAEALAFGTLLLEGTPVRLSGQDSARGTFSQRHSVWHDTQTQQAHVPLNHLAPEQGHFCVYNSMLSEAAVLGFDLGYSFAEPEMLVIWEAQFGDFANGAQSIIDQFLVASLAKWERASGLVLLLPHGYEGQGPEHSNAYLERYLAACAEDNLQVCNLTTPAQYFHALRRQQRRPFRRPLVVMSPKSLLRHRAAVSPVEQLTGGSFCEVLDDPRGARAVSRVVLCSGKVFYDLLAAREQEGAADVALVRIEQLYPFPAEQLRRILAGYPASAELVWAQEEPRNRGAWSYLLDRWHTLAPERPVRYVGRLPSASPATGSARAHRQQQQELVTGALQG